MSTARQRLGRRGEELAAQYLADAGYRIERRNWRCPAGEVDIVAFHSGTLVLVEVRARSSRACGLPEESITPAKRARLLTCGAYLAAELGWRGPWRVDVVAIEAGGAGSAPRLRLIANAVEAE